MHRGLLSGVCSQRCSVTSSVQLRWLRQWTPEDWADIVNELVANMAQCVERYGGTVAEFAGDSILAIFGAPVAHEDHPYRAVRAGLDILDKAGQWRYSASEIAVRAGIHTGLVVMGDVNAGDLSTYTALGDTPNVAARMQTLATPGGLFVSADTYRLVANDVTAIDLGPAEVKGKSEPVNVFEISGARHTSLRRRGVPAFRSPMVGRDAELARLLELVEYAKAGSGRVTAIIGHAGASATSWLQISNFASAMRKRRFPIWSEPSSWGRSATPTPWSLSVMRGWRRSKPIWAISTRLPSPIR